MSDGSETFGKLFGFLDDKIETDSSCAFFIDTVIMIAKGQICNGGIYGE